MANNLRSLLLTAALLLGLAPAGLLAQGQSFPPPPPVQSPIEGMIDFHVHSAPDVFGRSLTDFEIARLAQRQGMRALVFKNHVTSTADRAFLAMQQVKGIEIFGGIALNRAVGGINPAAVEWMYRMEGAQRPIDQKNRRLF